MDRDPLDAEAPGTGRRRRRRGGPPPTDGEDSGDERRDALPEAQTTLDEARATVAAERAQETDDAWLATEIEAEADEEYDREELRRLRRAVAEAERALDGRPPKKKRPRHRGRPASDGGAAELPESGDAVARHFAARQRAQQAQPMMVRSVSDASAAGRKLQWFYVHCFAGDADGNCLVQGEPKGVSWAVAQTGVVTLDQSVYHRTARPAPDVVVEFRPAGLADHKPGQLPTPIVGINGVMTKKCVLLEYAEWLNARMAIGASAGTRPRELKPKQLAAVFARPAFPVAAISRKAAVLVAQGGPVFQEVVAARLPADELTTRARELEAACPEKDRQGFRALLVAKGVPLNAFGGGEPPADDGTDGYDDDDDDGDPPPPPPREGAAPPAPRTIQKFPIGV